MDFVLVLPLILSFLSTGHSHTEFPQQILKLSHEKCQPGYHKAGDDCGAPAGKIKCVKCANGSYTDINNTSTKCQRCRKCGQYEVEEKPCSFDSNVVCTCKKGSFYNGARQCKDCKGPCEAYCDNPNYIKECQPCKRCLHVEACKRQCPIAPTSASTSARTSARTITITASGQPKSGMEMSWLILVVVLVTCLVVLWLLLLFNRNLFRYPESCLCWSVNKNPPPPVEDPKLNEQSVHQDSSPNTLVFNISEETPMMPLSPATPPEHQEAEHKVARQEEPTEHWPAIVLYAIIKEVPLRRWKEFLRLLSVADQQMERVELEAGLGLGSMEKQYQMLRLWSQRSTASLNDVFSALHYMDLSGCAQLLQESLEKLQ